MNGAFARLKELSQGWIVTLTTVEIYGDHALWELLLVDPANPDRTHTYVSTDLERLINHAWAGAPDGRC